MSRQNYYFLNLSGQWLKKPASSLKKAEWTDDFLQACAFSAPVALALLDLISGLRPFIVHMVPLTRYDVENDKDAVSGEALDKLKDLFMTRDDKHND